MSQDRHAAGGESRTQKLPRDGMAELLALGAEAPEESAPPVPRIAGYEVGGLLGQGGMGVVWRAVQLSTHRPVALKLLGSTSFGSDKARRRFEREVELAARLEHPHIARVYDSGAYHGSYYYAMELIEGQHLDQFVRQEKLSQRQILLLIRDVCSAVQYAHQRGVIHRDLKPSNILVSGDGQPHVVDFGLAKTLDGDGHDPTLTLEGQAAGTPAFMSPEQAMGSWETVDTRTDVYSLGAILYLLLTGQAPHDMTGPSFQVMRRLAEEQVVRPRRVSRTIDSELEAVLLKALAQEPERRYGSVAQLSEDIGSYLEGRPLVAGPESAVYRMRKWASRHRSAVLAVSAGLLLAVGAVSFYIRQIKAEQANTKAALIESDRQRMEAVAQRNEADRQKAIAEQVNSFLTSMFEAADPKQAQGREITALEVVNNAVAKLATQFLHEPLVKATLEAKLGEVLIALGRMSEAEPLLRQALDRCRVELGENDPDTITALHNYAYVLNALGRSEEAEPLYRQALERSRRVRGDDDPETINALSNYAGVLLVLGRSAEAEPLLGEVLVRRRRVLGEDHAATIDSMNNYAYVLNALGRPRDAEPLARASLDCCTRLLGPEHPQTAVAANNCAAVLMALGRPDQAEPLFRDVLNQRRRVLGIDHPDTLASISNLALALKDQARLAEAELLCDEALAGSRRVLGDDHLYTLRAMGNMAIVLQRRGELAEAESLFREALDRGRRVRGDDHPDTLGSMNNLAYLMMETGRLAEAESQFREALRGFVRTVGDEHPSTLVVMSSLARVMRSNGEWAEAELMLREALERSRRTLGDGHRDTLQRWNELIDFLRSVQRVEEADKLAHELQEVRATTKPATAPVVASS